jgi:hypothetical protein
MGINTYNLSGEKLRAQGGKIAELVAEIAVLEQVPIPDCEKASLDYGADLVLQGIFLSQNEESQTTRTDSCVHTGRSDVRGGADAGWDCGNDPGGDDRIADAGLVS